MTNNEDLTVNFFKNHFDQFFNQFMNLIGNGDYVTIRQCLSILSCILLDRQVMTIMIKFVNNENYLKIVLKIFNNESKLIHFENFQIFKIFAANPNKTQKNSKILFKNKNKIFKILNFIESDRLDDNEFKSDKNAVMAKLDSLLPPPPNRPAPQVSTNG